MKYNTKLLAFVLMLCLPTLSYAGNGNGNGNNNGNGDGSGENINGNSGNGNGNQNGNGNGGNGNHYGWDPGAGTVTGNTGTDVPLDGGLSLLAAAGAGYAIRRYATNKRNDPSC